MAFNRSNTSSCCVDRKVSEKPPNENVLLLHLQLVDQDSDWEERVIVVLALHGLEKAL